MVGLDQNNLCDGAVVLVGFLWFGFFFQVPQVSSSTGATDSTFTVPDDVGLGYEGGVRVLQSLGSW